MVDRGFTITTSLTEVPAGVEARAEVDVKDHTGRTVYTRVFTQQGPKEDLREMRRNVIQRVGQWLQEVVE